MLPVTPNIICLPFNILRYFFISSSSHKAPHTRPSDQGKGTMARARLVSQDLLSATVIYLVIKELLGSDNHRLGQTLIVA